MEGNVVVNTEKYDKETLESVRMTMNFLKNVPDIPEDVRGKEFTSECSCGGVIRARRSTYNGHLWAECGRCGMKIIE